MSTQTQTIEELATQEYKYGFVTDVEADSIPKAIPRLHLLRAIRYDVLTLYAATSLRSASIWTWPGA